MPAAFSGRGNTGKRAAGIAAPVRFTTERTCLSGVWSDRQLPRLKTSLDTAEGLWRRVRAALAPGSIQCGIVPERFAFENICRPVPVFRLTGFTSPPELDAAIDLRRHQRRRGAAPLPSARRTLRIRRAEMSLALPDSAEHFFNRACPRADALRLHGGCEGAPSRAGTRRQTRLTSDLIP